MGMKKSRSVIRVLTNTPWLVGRSASGRPLHSVDLQSRGSWINRLYNLMLWRYDLVLLNIECRWLLAICAARKLFPFARCRIISVDLILTRPSGFRSYALFLVRRWLLKEVDCFLLYYRDTEELRRVYSFPRDKVRYVPFKVNTFDQVLALEPSDEGFILACGRSNRDYGTLFSALQGLPITCYVLAPWHEASNHGTEVDGAVCPSNVHLVSDDGSPDSWNRWIARARAVVLPIQPGRLSPSGISTYLVAMALNKCVVITESPATRQILDDRNAVLVPPSDAGALRAALTRVVEDREFREQVAQAGRRYALALGGEERLIDDVVRELTEILAKDLSPQQHTAAEAALPTI